MLKQSYMRAGLSLFYSVLDLKEQKQCLAYSWCLINTSVLSLLAEIKNSMGTSLVTNVPANAGDTRDSDSIWLKGPGRSPWLENGILAWKMPWIEDSDGLLSMGLQRVRHDWTQQIHAKLMMNFQNVWHILATWLIFSYSLYNLVLILAFS